MGTGPHGAHGVWMESAWLERWHEGRRMWTSDRRRSQKIHELTICAGLSLCECLWQFGSSLFDIGAQHYNFGTSEIVKKVVFKSRIQGLITGLADYGPVFLTFHDNNQDIKSAFFLMFFLHLTNTIILQGSEKPWDRARRPFLCFT